MTDNMQRARELLAAEYERDGHVHTAAAIRGLIYPASLNDDRALRAIAAALSTQQQGQTAMSSEDRRAMGWPAGDTAPPSPPVGMGMVVSRVAQLREAIESEPEDCFGASMKAGRAYGVRENLLCIVGMIEESLAQQPAADPLVQWANSSLNFTATVGVFKDGVQPAAVDGACESAAEDCGPVARYDSDGVALCERCYRSLGDSP